MKEEVSGKSGQPVMLMISSCGQPVALVPAESIEQAQKRAVELLRGEQGRQMGLLTHDVNAEVILTRFAAGSPK